ncbi:LOW QUALITY PROTEIN: gap junction delta-3 protein-like [Colossoma macropomum]|uniref:LOW QUALITY PROTEIN: gap junction delta-3 protein-like n=1 Tax=Colossoma macropomum TaxID=42526 RepID=UPI001864D3EF|nr:LOW QUALITY PROTEIN: gap junction delta-3 protein-like [Colossoma macropomum]
MSDWGFLSGLFGSLQAHSPMLGRFWLLLMLVFRMLILGMVASDMFDDEQEEFSCNTLQPGCKQVCYDQAFPISQYRFWVFHIVLISTPALVFLMYAMHHHKKWQDLPRGSASSILEAKQKWHLKRLYMINVGFRLLSEMGFLVGQWLLYGFRVEAQFPCSRFPCPYTVDCFTSRPMEKTVFLVFYFVVGVLAAFSSLVELVHITRKWLMASRDELVPWEDVELKGGTDLPQNTRNLAAASGTSSGRARRPLFFPGKSGRNYRRSKGTVRNNGSTTYSSIKSLNSSKNQKSTSLVV